MIIKTIVSKNGNVQDYVNLPVLNNLFGEINTIKPVGTILDAVEVENGYELTIAMFKEFSFEFMKQPVAMGFSIN